VGDAIGQVLALGVAVGLSPIPIVGIVLMLGTPRARSNGPAFVVGWLVGILAVGGAVLALSSGADASDGGSPAEWVSVLKLGLGGLLLTIAARQWRGRPSDGDAPETPQWMQTVDSFTATRSAALAMGLAAVNPKNLVLVVAAAAAIAQTGASTGDQTVALLVFAALASVGVAAPVVLYFAMGERSKRLLDRIQQRMASNSAAIMAVICLLIGAKLIGDAIGALSG
jgi:hypothetical protein